jgi:DNA ligase D-like protein (predicted 3'-phosphoesterase)
MPRSRRVPGRGSLPPAARLTLHHDDPETLRDQLITQARRLGVMGWARADGPKNVRAHVEGPEEALSRLDHWAHGAADVAVEHARAEGHEQFAARGVSAGVFVVQEHQATAHHFDLRLEVDGVMRSWAVPKGPSLDPAIKRLAVQVPDHSLAHNRFEGRLESGGVIIWDRGEYEQGGRVSWPEALERGHGVFVLHGEKLRGGFALQRTSTGAAPAQWLLIKRRDDEGRPGSDVVAERPQSVHSGRTLAELLAGNQRAGSGL